MQPHENLDLRDLEGEIWKDIKGYEGFYQVSNLGRVKTFERKPKINSIGRMNKLYPQKILKQIFGNGYTCVKLCKNNCVKVKSVHRLVAETFILPINNKTFVNHKNGVRHQNNVDNLEWVTHRENIQHAYNVLGVKSPIGKDRYWAGKEIYQYSKNGDLISKWVNSEEIKRKTGMCNSGIRQCCNKKLITSQGFVWSYVELPKEYFNRFIS